MLLRAGNTTTSSWLPPIVTLPEWWVSASMLLRAGKGHTFTTHCTTGLFVGGVGPTRLLDGRPIGTRLPAMEAAISTDCLVLVGGILEVDTIGVVVDQAQVLDPCLG